MDSDDNFMIYRRFGFLYSRLLLEKQDELREIEEKLDETDKRDANGSEGTQKCLQSRSRDQRDNDVNDDSKRRAIMRKAEEKLYVYGKEQFPKYPLHSKSGPLHGYREITTAGTTASVIEQPGNKRPSKCPKFP